jgi:hypothetical protein
MFSMFKVTEFYCMANDFCKEFVFQQEKSSNLVRSLDLLLFRFYDRGRHHDHLLDGILI